MDKVKRYEALYDDGEYTVTVDGAPLPKPNIHSPSGFCWGYHGSGPADLALAILANHFGENVEMIRRYFFRSLPDHTEPKAWKYHQSFKAATIANWNMSNSHSIDTVEIQEILNAIDAVENQEHGR